MRIKINPPCRPLYNSLGQLLTWARHNQGEWKQTFAAADSLVGKDLLLHNSFDHIYYHAPPGAKILVSEYKLRFEVE